MPLLARFSFPLNGPSGATLEERDARARDVRGTLPRVWCFHQSDQTSKKNRASICSFVPCAKTCVQGRSKRQRMDPPVELWRKRPPHPRQKLDLLPPRLARAPEKQKHHPQKAHAEGRSGSSSSCAGVGWAVILEHGNRLHQQHCTQPLPRSIISLSRTATLLAYPFYFPLTLVLFLVNISNNTTLPPTDNTKKDAPTYPPAAPISPASAGRGLPPLPWRAATARAPSPARR